MNGPLALTSSRVPQSRPAGSRVVAPARSKQPFNGRTPRGRACRIIVRLAERAVTCGQTIGRAGYLAQELATSHLVRVRPPCVRQAAACGVCPADPAACKQRRSRLREKGTQMLVKPNLAGPWIDVRSFAPSD